MDISNPKRDLNYRLVRYFLNHTQLSVLLFVLVVLGGIFGFSRLRVEGFPEVPIPIAIVSVVSPGAGPDTIAESVVAPIESAIEDVKGVKEVSSTSQNNIGIIVVSFNEGVDVTTAVQDVRTKASNVSLPEGTQTPEISVPDFAGPTYIVAVSGGASLNDLESSSETLKDKLLAVEDVKSVELLSGIKQNIYIDIAPQYQLPDVISQITSSDVEFPLGQAIINGQLTTITGKRQVKSIDDLRALPISLNGQVFKLADIASVNAGVDYGGQIHWIGYTKEDGGEFIRQKALLYDIRLKADADILSTDPKVLEAIKLANEEVDSAEFVTVYNIAEESRRQVDEIVEGAVGGKWDEVDGPAANIGYVFGGIWLLMIAILAFLDWRSALVSAASIPLSFLATFMFLGLFDIQLNTIVLFSLVLVLGLIADPAIVIIESIKRYIEIGKRGKDAVFGAVGTVGQGIFIAVLTSLVVFVPFAIVSGTFGAIIKYIPLTVIPALVASYFVPMLFLTWISAKFLKGKPNVTLHDEDDPATLWPIARWFIKANRYILSHVAIQVTVIILAFVIPVGIAGWLFSSGQIRQVQFAQPAEAEFLMIEVPVQPTTTEPLLIAQSAVLDEILKKFTNSIDTYFYQYQGKSGGTAQPFTVFVHLLPPKDRIQKSDDIIASLNADLEQQFGEKAFAYDLGAGPPQGNYPVSVKIYDHDPAKLLAAAQKVADELRNYEEVTAVRYDGDEPNTELAVQIRSEALASRGLTPPALFGQINGALGERSLFTLGEYNVVLRTPSEKEPNSVEALGNTIVFGSQGPVALKDVADIVPTEVPGAIQRLNGDRYITVSARVSDSRDVINVQREINDWVKANTGTLGLDEASFGDRASTDEFEKSFQELFAAIALSILVTYIIFVLFFRSFVQPLIILVAVPLLFIGAFPALVWFGDGQLGFLETLGVIMVIGIVENVGIFLIDYANRKVAGGMDRKEAIALSAGIRFRPVILTKLTALAGLLPLAIFAPFWRGLAVVVIGGILSSGILSLFTTPVLYTWFTRNKKKPELGQVHEVSEPAKFEQQESPTEPIDAQPLSEISV
ncbi:MAG: efflux RND transporter permease subunit [Candidatus Doudnabacteria bacterium]|nr:efflux RND transporter permease subunit [Candidatus Doudnabacteria bacterium]